MRIAFLLLLLGTAAIPASAAGPDAMVLSVPGIPGPYCAYGLEKRLLQIESVKRVEIIWAKEELRVIPKDGARIGRDRIEEAVRRADYPYRYRILP